MKITKRSIEIIKKHKRRAKLAKRLYKNIALTTCNKYKGDARLMAMVNKPQLIPVWCG